MKYAAITERLAGLGSDKWAVHLEGKRRAAAGENMLFLSIGEPDAATPKPIIDMACQQMRSGRTLYSSGRGETAVLEALSQKYSRSTGRPISTDQFIFVTGTQSALFLAMMSVVELGDEVLLADPYYATYEAVIAAAGGVTNPITVSPDNGFHLTAELLQKAITPKSRVLLLNSPSNPTGAVLSRETILKIGEICQEHDLWIISDEVYASMIYGDVGFASPFDEPWLEQRCIVVSSLSKSHAMPGFRLGWIAASAEFCAHALPVSETMLFGTQPFLQDAAAFALSNQFAEVDFMRQSYEARARALIKGLSHQQRISARMPEGGMFVMLDVRQTGLSGEAFAFKLLEEEKVVTMPGESFGPGGSGHIRISLTANETEIAEACHRLIRCADRLG